MVEGDGKSDPNRNIYRVFDDDYVPVKDRLAPEEEPQIDPHNIQTKMPTGSSDRYDPGKRKGSGMKALAVAGAILILALLISVSLLSGWLSIGIAGIGSKATTQDVKVGDLDTIFPLDDSILNSNNITLAWTPAQNAVNYELMIDMSPAFTPPLKNVLINGTTYSLKLTDGLYYWKVIAVGEKTFSNWTSTMNFEVRTVLDISGLLTPLNHATITNMSSYYTWSAVDHADLYRLQVGNDSNFSSPAIDALTNGTQYSVTYPYVNGETYYWRVMSFNGSIQSQWTTARSFTVAITLSIPSLTSPSSSAVITSDSMIFNWTAVSGAFIYRLQVDNSSKFLSPVIDVLSKTSHYQVSGLKTNATYYWRVMASNEDYQSAWSPTSSFLKGFQYFLRSYSWVYNGHTFSFNLNISGQTYYEQREQNRDNWNPYSFGYAAHVNSTDLAIEQAAAAIKAEAVAMGYDSENTLDLALAFVQNPNIMYESDLNTTGYIEYVRYPVESLVDKVGDCNCKSVLFMSLIQTTELGYNGVFLIYNGNPGHMAVGVAGTYSDYNWDYSYSYYPYLGQNYYYCETTGYGWLVGQLPPGESSAIIIPA